MDVEKFHRRSIRLKGYDYTLPGAYFVTLVTKDRECLFGEVEADEMHLNRLGVLVDNEWRGLGDRFHKVVMDEWVVMPNHLHGILVILERDSNGDTGMVQVGARQGSSDASPQQGRAAPPGSLGAIIGAYKSSTTRLINGLRHRPGEKVWQRNYYEHIIQNEKEWEAIRSYIDDNPAKWELDRENPNRDRAIE